MVFYKLNKQASEKGRKMPPLPGKPLLAACGLQSIVVPPSEMLRFFLKKLAGIPRVFS